MAELEISKWTTISILLLFCVSSLHGYGWSSHDSPSSAPSSQYDFIVVGAGAGGCTVARRLAEANIGSVLLIESGHHPEKDYEIPAYATKVFANPGDFTWQYQSVPQKNARLLENGIIHTLAGRMLGGTTSMNGMAFNRGHPSCYANWANLTGDPSWRYENMLPFMKRVETYAGDYPSAEHGFDGPITITRPKWAPGLVEYWYQAGVELGLNPPTGNDPNGPQRPGFSPFEFSKKFGRRQDAYYGGYIAPVNMSLTNLDVLQDTNVTQIYFARERAEAVKLDSKVPGVPAVIFAKKEIIVSCGAYGSPLLLQRSGLGPKDVLDAAKIPQVKELPVGRNLQDHAMTGVQIAINNNSVAVLEDETRDLNPMAWEYYLKYGDGPYSASRGAFGQGFMVSSVARSEGHADWPDIQVQPAHCIQTLQPTLAVQADNSSFLPGEYPMNIFTFLARPKSRGEVKVNPKDPMHGNPYIDFGFFTDPEGKDLRIMIEGMIMSVKIMENTIAYGQKLAARFLPPPLKPCAKFQVGPNFKYSYDYWECFIKQTMNTGCHAAGTCKMGRVGDPTAVVDPQLRVIGIEGLRVIDASVFPTLTNANTQAPTYAVAEKGAQMIIDFWKQTAYPTRNSPAYSSYSNPLLSSYRS